jgi:hypothetical protein
MEGDFSDNVENQGKGEKKQKRANTSKWYSLFLLDYLLM